MEPAAIEQMYQIENHHWWFVGKRLLVAVLLGEVLDTGRLRILDIGCGTGAVLAHFKERARAVGVDHSPLALAYCRKRGLALLACADGERLPFVPASFDVILMLDVLEHAIDDVGLLRAVGALLRPGGMVLVSVPAFQGLWSPHDEVLHHLRRYTARGLRRVMNEAGFVVERLTYTNVAAFPPAAIARGILPRVGLARPAGTTDFRVHTPWVNRALIAAYQLEALALRHVRSLPIGLSVAALARPARFGDAGQT